MTALIVLCVFVPALMAAIVGLSSRTIPVRIAQGLTCGGMLLSLTCALTLFYDVAVEGHSFAVTLLDWIQSGAFTVSWGLKVDTLTAVMLVVVTLVSTMVHIYSVGYMSHDEHQPRFFAYLSLFTFFMLMLVTSSNLLQLFFGWEGVGLASYLLINFWFKKDSANAAAMKAFVVNRVGDVGFALGIMGVYVLFGSVEFSTILNVDNILSINAKSFQFLSFHGDALTIVCLLLFVGAMGKSAQLGLHTWLPDAMEGPTPVSALIHAATMVTAGVFMVCRLSPLFEHAPVALAVVAVIGALTAIVAATIGLTQFDIKRVIAYSTMSQLGYMFFAVGSSAYGAAMFHLTTHAFFKALLFLCAGSVIHALDGEQDMRKMGGVYKLIPVTYAFMWIGSLALAGIGVPGVFGFAGFYSKDIILESAFATHQWFGALAYWLGIAAAFMTAFYSWRLLLLTFHGKPRWKHGDHHGHDHSHAVHAHNDHAHGHSQPHESPLIMLLPLVPLALGALVAGIGLYDWFVGEERAEFWRSALFVLPSRDSIEAAHHGEEWVGVLPLVVGLLGIAMAYVTYSVKPGLADRMVVMFNRAWKLFYNKYYIDELYDRLFVRSSKWLGQEFWQVGDTKIIDGLGPDGIAKTAQRAGVRLANLQTGYIYHYAFAIVLGLVALTGWFVWRH